MEHVPPRESNRGRPLPRTIYLFTNLIEPIQALKIGMGDAVEHRKLLVVVIAIRNLKESPMFSAHANLIFFAYVAVVVGICPICERLANHFSK